MKIYKFLNIVNLHINNLRPHPPKKMKLSNDSDENEELQWVGKVTALYFYL